MRGRKAAAAQAAGSRQPATPQEVAQLRQALLEHKVVFLRGQSLDYPRQVAFAERLGPLTLGHPTLASPPDKPYLEEIDSRQGVRANHWHTDVTFVNRPPAFTLLHGVVIPAVGGDTIWANTATATKACRLTCVTWPTGCASSTPTTTTTRR